MRLGSILLLTVATMALAPPASAFAWGGPALVQEVPQDAPAPPPPPPAPPGEVEPSPIPPRLRKDAEVAPFQPAPPELDRWRDVPVAEDTLQPRETPADLLSRYRSDPDFQYDRPRAERPSWWDRFKAWLARTFLYPMLEGLASRGGRTILIVLAILLIGWVITRLLRADVGSPFSRRDVDAGTAGPLLDVEEIAEVDVETLLAEALRQSDFREAVRYRYLLTLQALDARGAIRWGRHKTNREYVRETREAAGADLADPFADVTRVFDWVWYGERPVGRARYDRLGPLFDRLDAALADLRRQPASPR